MTTARENNFREGRIRRPHEFSTRSGADGIGFSKFTPAKQFSETQLSPSELKKSYVQDEQIKLLVENGLLRSQVRRMEWQRIEQAYLLLAAKFAFMPDGADYTDDEFAKVILERLKPKTK